MTATEHYMILAALARIERLLERLDRRFESVVSPKYRLDPPAKADPWGKNPYRDDSGRAW